MGRVSPLDHADLRGWQFVLGGTVLGTLSPFGFDDGMTGRWAWMQDGHDRCLRGLLRLRRALEAAGRKPRSVSLLPDRSSRILGLAAASLFDLPTQPDLPGTADTVVVAYSLDDLRDPDGPSDLIDHLRNRAPGEVVHEHASCWTNAPITADSIGLLHQIVVPPWGSRLRRAAPGELVRDPVDDRPPHEIANDIVDADATPDEGDGTTAPDTDESFTSFVQSLADRWLQGPRDFLRSPGPVPSSRFV